MVRLPRVSPPDRLPSLRPGGWRTWDQTPPARLWSVGPPWSLAGEDELRGETHCGDAEAGGVEAGGVEAGDAEAGDGELRDVQTVHLAWQRQS